MKTNCRVFKHKYIGKYKNIKIDKMVVNKVDDENNKSNFLVKIWNYKNTMIITD